MCLLCLVGKLAPGLTLFLVIHSFSYIFIYSFIQQEPTKQILRPRAEAGPGVLWWAEAAPVPTLPWLILQ